MTVKIQTANTSDIKTLVTLWQEIDQFPEAKRPFGGDSEDKPFHAEQLLKQTLISPLAIVLLAHDTNRKIVGTISGHVFDKPAVNISKIGVIYSLWVHQEYRQQGIGQQLLDTLEKQLQEKGARAFQVGWDTSNQLAEQWWKKRGYNPYETIASKIIE